MNLKKHVPNIITLLNLFSGCLAIVCITLNQYENAFLMVCLGIFFDFFDGFFARLLKVSSPLGLQLDSLADMVTSGVVPGFMMYKLIANLEYDTQIFSPFATIGFIITLGACYRLANFNIDTRQTNSFIGLPTPANALVIMSLPLIVGNNLGNPILEIFMNKWILVAITLLSAYIMNAEIPLFALKIKELEFQKSKLQILFLAISAVLLLALHYLAIPVIIIFYVLLSILNNRFAKK